MLLICALNKNPIVKIVTILTILTKILFELLDYKILFQNSKGLILKI